VRVGHVEGHLGTHRIASVGRYSSREVLSGSTDNGAGLAAEPGEAAFLERVAEIFGFAPGEFRRIRAAHFAPELTDPYVILGVSYVASEEEIKQTYRRLVRENHPDSLIARGVPPEFVKLATDKLAAINNAYEKIQQERGLSS